MHGREYTYLLADSRGYIERIKHNLGSGAKFCHPEQYAEFNFHLIQMTSYIDAFATRKPP